MPLSVDDILRMIDAAVALRDGHDDPISKGRCLRLLYLREAIRQTGFDMGREERLKCCLMPFVFQELNYDDYDWSNCLAPLGHLEDIVDIDVVVWSGGLRRSELSDPQYEEYSKFCHRAVTFWSNR